jgi:hypothetical protein
MVNDAHEGRHRASEEEGQGAADPGVRLGRADAGEQEEGAMAEWILESTIQGVRRKPILPTPMYTRVVSKLRGVVSVSSVGTGVGGSDGSPTLARVARASGPGCGGGRQSHRWRCGIRAVIREAAGRR